MAGDWIKMRTNLWDHPKVVKLASAICPQNVRENSDTCPQNVRRMSNRAFVIGALFRTWTLADAYTADGVLDGYDAEMLDDFVGYPGWSQNLAHIGWLVVEPQRLIVPGFTEHNGESSKRRSEDAARKKRVRKMSDKCPQNVRRNSDQRREEKRREDITKGQSQTKRLPAAPLDFDLNEVDPADWCKYFREFDSDLAADREDDRRLLAQLAWLVCAGAPILADVRDCIEGCRVVVPSPTNPVGYLRECLNDSIGEAKIESMLAAAPKRNACAKFLGGLS